MNITNSKGPGATVTNGGSLIFDEATGAVNIKGKGYGAYLDNGILRGTDAPSRVNATATGSGGIGLYAINDSSSSVSKVVANGKGGMGVYADNYSDAQAQDITAAGAESTGVHAGNFSEVQAVDVTASAMGARAMNGSIISATNDITATAPGSTGVYVTGSSGITAHGVKAVSTGAQVSGSGSLLEVFGNITATGAGSIGLLAQSRAEVHIEGSVTAKARGISAQGTGTVVEAYSAIVDGKNGIGVYAGAGSAVTVDRGIYTPAPSVSSTGTGGVGVQAEGGKANVAGDVSAAGTGVIATAYGEAAIDGKITGKNGEGSLPSAAYIKTGTQTKTITDNAPTTKAGYKTYTDGANTVWVADVNKDGVVVVSDASGFNDKIAAVQTPGPDYGKVIMLGASITSGVVDIDITSDVLIELHGYGIECVSLDIKNGSLVVVDAIGGGTLTATQSITLDNGVLITPKTGVTQATANVNGAGTDTGMVAAANGSIVDIKGKVNSPSTTSCGLAVTGGSKVSVDSVSVGIRGVYAAGKGTEAEVRGSVLALGKGEGVVAEDGAKITVGGQAVCVSGNGIEASGGASVTLTRSAAPEFAAYPDVYGSSFGIYAMGKGTTVNVKGEVGSMTLVPNYAIRAEDGASVSVDASMVPGGSVHTRDSGAFAEGAGSFISVRVADGGSLSAVGRSGLPAAFAVDGGEIYVGGNIIKNGPDNISYGVWAERGGKITVDGEIYFKDTTYPQYIVLGGGGGREKDEADPVTTKPGYRTYSSTQAGVTSAVWVRAQQPDHVCRIGEDYFLTLKAAIDAIPYGGKNTITMLKDLSISGDLKLAADDKDVTIDLNGCNLALEDTDLYGSGFTISNNGRLTFDNSGAGGKEALIKGDESGVLVTSNSSLVLSERFKAGRNTLDVEGGFYGLCVESNCAATVTNAKVHGAGMFIFGVWAIGTGAIAEVLGNTTVTDIYSDGVGAYAINGGRITVGGDAIGRACGACADYSKSRVVVGGSARASRQFGAFALNGGTVIVGGDATVASATGYGAHAMAGANGEDTVVEVGGDAVGGVQGAVAYGSDEAAAIVTVKGKATGSFSGAYASDNSIVSVGGVQVNAGSSASRGVNVEYGGQVHVAGDIVTNMPGTLSSGVVVSDGGSVTVDGAIINTDSRYAVVGSAVLAESDYSLTPYKAGYLTYTEDAPNAGLNVVWVREKGSAPAVTTPAGPLKSGKLGELYSAGLKAVGSGPMIYAINSGALPPGLALDGSTGEITGIAEGPGLYSFSVTVRGDYGTSAPVSFSIEIANAVNPLTISPTHAILTNTGDEAIFEANLNISNPDYGQLGWSCPGVDPSKWLAGLPGNSFGFKLGPDDLFPQTLTVTVKYDADPNYYEATATIEVIPGGIGEGTTAKVLETKVTVNKAKATGALVPVLITDQKPQDLGITAFSVPGSSEPKTGSQIAWAVELFAQNSKTKAWDVPLPLYAANMYADDQRYIEITADAKAKKTSKSNKAIKAKVFVRAAGGAASLDAGIITITTVEKWPKLKAKAGSLNLFLPENAAALTVTAANGSKCIVDSIKPPKGKDYFSCADGSLSLKAGAKKGTVKKVAVNVSVDGYRTPKTMPKVNVKIVNTAPKLKLSQKSVKLLGAKDFGGEQAAAAEIGLLSGNKKIPFESNYKIAGVTTTKANLDVKYAGGVIYVTPEDGCKTGKATLKIAFSDTAKTTSLPLTVTICKKSDLKLTSKTKSVKVNKGHADGPPPKDHIADIPISLGVANYTVNDWEVSANKGAMTPPPGEAVLDGAIKLTPGAGKITLRVEDQARLADLVLLNKDKDVKYTLTIKSPSLPGKKLSVNLTIAANKSKGTITKKGKIDVANPASAVTVTVKLTNTSSKIASVELLKSGAPSGDFAVTGISGNKFKIASAHNQVVPGVQQTLTARVTLKSGVPPLDITVKVKPVQGKGKAKQSLKAVTLYKSTPMYGSGPVKLSLTKPANVRLGKVAVNPASLKAMKLSDGGFRLEQNGSNDYTIYFEGGRAPAVFDKKTGGLGKLKASYTLKLDLWAEGTYKLDSAGQPAALGYYNANGKWVAKSKPTTVKVKVNIR